jgi:hypothetical protein
MSTLEQELIKKISRLAPEKQRKVLEFLQSIEDTPVEINQDYDEDLDDARILTEVLGDALNPDGTIDFDKLEKDTIPITLEELYPEAVEEDES